jgi:hypothetical protein
LCSQFVLGVLPVLARDEDSPAQLFLGPAAKSAAARPLTTQSFNAAAARDLFEEAAKLFRRCLSVDRTMQTYDAETVTANADRMFARPIA